MPVSDLVRGAHLAPQDLQGPQAFPGPLCMTAMRLWSLARLDLRDCQGMRGLRDQRVTKEKWVFLAHQGSSRSTCSSWRLR